MVCLDIMGIALVAWVMDARKYFLIVNLIAGRGRCKQLFPKIRQELDRRKIDYDLHYTNEPMEAVDVAKMGIEAGFTHLVAMGGDGTVNEVVNGMYGSDAVLAVIPAGTGNDFIRSLGIPDDPVGALDTLIHGKERTIDIGRVAEDRCFVNGLGVGLDAKVAQTVLQKERRHATAYLFAAIKEALRFPAFPVEITTEEGSFSLDCVSLGIANAPYCGGGFKLAPRATMTDGLIDIAAIGDFPKLERLIRLPQARAGKHLGLSRVRYQQTTRAEITSSSKLVAHIDGEPYRLPRNGFAAEVLPQAIRVITS